MRGIGLTLTEAYPPPRVVGGFEGLEGDALADLFRLDGAAPSWTNRTSLLNIGGQMLGGHIAAIGLKSATLSAGGTVPSALHVLFLSAPEPSQSCDIYVEPLRDGRRFAHRLTRMSQNGQIRAQVSTTLSNEGLIAQAPFFEHHQTRPLAPEPDTLATRDEVRASASFPAKSIHTLILSGHPFLDIRFVPHSLSDDGRALFWVKVPGFTNFDVVDHFCMLTLISDFWFTLPVHDLPSARATLGTNFATTSLDHALWFHGRPDCSAWMLFEMSAPVASGGIAAMQARVWSQDGRVIATCLQHALIIPRTDHAEA